MPSRKLLLPTIGGGLVLAVAMTLTFLMGPTSDVGDNDDSERFRKKTGANQAIVFVHGLLGDWRKTWTNERNGAFWPDLVAEDPDFAQVDVYAFGYESGLNEGPLTPDQLADNLDRTLRAERIDKYQAVIFIAHSMGGVIVRQYLLRHRPTFKVPMAYFLATPTTGADIVTLARVFSGNRQLDSLKDLEDNLYLQSLMGNWQRSGFGESIVSYCAYETRDTLGVRIVPQQSATNLCNRFEPLPEDHIRISKPADRKSDTYLAVKLAFEESVGNQKLIASDKLVEITAAEGIEWGRNSTLVAGELVFGPGSFSIPEGALVLANVLRMSEDTVLSGPDFSLVAGLISGGTVSVSGAAGRNGLVGEEAQRGENGGDVLVAAGRLIGLKVLASGGNGGDGYRGQNGRDGRDGTRGRNAKCGAGMFGKFVGSTDGGNGTDGTNGEPGGPAGDGGNGGHAFILSINELSSQPSVAKGSGGTGGSGGKPGRGGRGGQGGNGCSGIGGSQPDRPAGLNGKDGREGDPGSSGEDGAEGTIFSNRISRLAEIAAVVPADDAIPDYRDQIILALRSSAKGEAK